MEHANLSRAIRFQVAVSSYSATIVIPGVKVAGLKLIRGYKFLLIRGQEFSFSLFCLRLECHSQVHIQRQALKIIILIFFIIGQEEGN